MVKVKTLVEKLTDGYELAFAKLDIRVEELGDIDLLDIKDQVWPSGYALDQAGTSHIERIVIYNPVGLQNKGV
ncbi:MAG: hypothetical protein KKB20_02330 [Proteobacteria bacterium]|nr:hypothetical protein [Pseudomonadota bacterium]